jgi:hypothetical protein
MGAPSAYAGHMRPSGARARETFDQIIDPAKILNMQIDAD